MSNLVYLIYRNSDMTEGRGPMTVCKVMADREKAIQFALDQPGVMGIRNRQTRVDVPKQIRLEWLGPYGKRLVEGDWEVLEVETE